MENDPPVDPDVDLGKLFDELHDQLKELGDARARLLGPIASAHTPSVASNAPAVTASGLPVLPPFFQKLQVSDRVAKGRALPAIVLVTDHNGDEHVFGDCGNGSCMRLRTENLSLHSSFAVNVRQHHFTGNERQMVQQARDVEKRRGNDVPEKTPAGRDPREYSWMHVEEEFEFDLNEIAGLTMSRISEDDTVLRGVFHKARKPMPGGRQYGFMKFRLKKGARSTRIRQQVAMFDVQSPQLDFAKLALSYREPQFVIFLNLNQAHYKQSFDGFETVVAARECSGDGQPRNDWFFSRFEHYQPDALLMFNEYTSNADRKLPVFPWPIEEKDTGGDVLRLAYNVDAMVPRLCFGSAQSYQAHLMVALLYERDERVRQQSQQYNHVISYSAAFTHLHGVHYAVDIRARGEDNVAVGGNRLVPSASTQISVYLADVPDSLYIGMLGRVQEYAPEGFEFRVVVTLPDELDDHTQILDVGKMVAVHIIWTDGDEDNRRKMGAVSQACTQMQQRLPKDDLVMVNGRLVGSFCIRNIIADQETRYFAPNLVQHFLASQDGPADRRSIADFVAALPSIVGLDKEQTKAYRAALDGPIVNTLLIEGFPGTGKSTVLACLIVALMSMGYRALVVCQSNSGVDALHARVKKCLTRDLANVIKWGGLIDDLKERTVRLRSNAIEREIAKELQSGLEQDPSPLLADNDSMAACIDRWVRNLPSDQLALEYNAYVRFQRLGTNPPKDRPFSTVMALLRDRVLHEAR